MRRLHLPDLLRTSLGDRCKIGRLLPVRTLTAMRRAWRLTFLGMFRPAVSNARNLSAFAAAMKVSILVGLRARFGGSEHRVFERVSAYGRGCPVTWHDASCPGGIFGGGKR